MLSKINKLVARAANTGMAWRILNATLLRVTRQIEWEHDAAAHRKRRATINEEAARRIPDLTVRHGVFQGMRYPAAESCGSTLFPKLLGSYELEIQPIIESICETQYAEIVDVGCAEGYYAIGLAMRVPGATVHAYDTDETAIRYCREMAELNGVAGRVVTGSFCGPDRLAAMQFSGRALVLSDCEGYEDALFTDDVVRVLSAHDVLIETHDFIDINLSTKLRERFRRTHAVTSVVSVDDVTKAITYGYDLLRDTDLATRKALLAEERPCAMTWLFCKSLGG